MKLNRFTYIAFGIMLGLLAACGTRTASEGIGEIPGGDNNTNNPGNGGQDNGGDDNEPEEEEPTPFMLLIEAVQLGELDKVQSMLDDDANLLNTKKDETEESLLIIATKFNQWEVVKILLDRGIDTTITDADGHDAEWHAKELGNELLVSLIRGELTQEDLNQAFLEGVQSGDFDGIAFLIKIGADINAVDANDRSALIFAISKGDVDLVEMLLDYGIDTMVTVRGGRKMEAADYAEAVNANPDIIALLRSRQG